MTPKLELPNESDSSRMSTSAAELVSRRAREQHQQRLLVLNLHLLANPGDSLLLQHSLDRLIRWICPSLRVFHVSERASPHGGYARLCPQAGSPSLAITFFLHEAYGEERILKVLDFFQRPPWQYHHTESCSSKSAGLHNSSGSSAVNALLRPYLLPSRDFYSLGAGMPVWGVRPVHCGGEILRVTLYSAYDNYEDAVRFYETVLQQQAEEQKTGFCWFTLHTEPGLCLQLAIKQVSAGVCVEPCDSAVLQFGVDEIGQLVPLLPNPCTPISTSRWQTEDLDGNKVLFQVKTTTQAKPPLTCAFPPTSAAPPRAMQLKCGGHTQNVSPSNRQAPPAWQSRSAGLRVADESAPEKPPGSQGSGSLCSTPPSSSCYSSQRSSPAPPPSSDSPLRPPLTRSLSRLPPEENEREGETNVDTGIPVLAGITRSSSVELLSLCRPRNPSAKARSPPGKWRSSDCADDVSNFRARRTTDSSYIETSGAAVELFAKTPPSLANAEEQADEFFI
ncbi:protein FAM124B isoform X1 [Hippocampus zosterae]|uniref:protein FAM124B isoform X1 n=2 Tax=Hippocampus zosterae TaxID=109293 RepID=UPI00223CF00D|nr:protein FAM124B isoform X1 [Hippocampus zosterae]